MRQPIELRTFRFFAGRAGCHWQGLGCQCSFEKVYVNLAAELVRLLGANELFTFVLFTFVRVPGVVGTNNISEQALCDPVQDRRTDQASRSVGSARRRTILASRAASAQWRLL